MRHADDPGDCAMVVARYAFLSAAVELSRAHAPRPRFAFLRGADVIAPLSAVRRAVACNASAMTIVDRMLDTARALGVPVPMYEMLRKLCREVCLEAHELTVEELIARSAPWGN